MTDSEVARLSTELLRTSGDPIWTRLRELLRQRDIDPITAVVADFFPDDVDLEFGVLLTPDGHVYEFDFTYGSRGDIKTKTATGQISDWREMTDRWRDRPYRNQIEAAIPLLGGASPAT
jgi:hypothetical protein